MSALTGCSLYLFSNIFGTLLRLSALLFCPSVTGQMGRGSLCWWTLVSQLFCGLLQGWGGQRGRVSEPRGQAEPRQPVPGPHAQPVQLRQQLRQRDLHPGCCPHRQQRTGHRVHVSVSHTHTHIHMGSVCVCDLNSALHGIKSVQVQLLLSSCDAHET